MARTALAGQDDSALARSTGRTRKCQTCSSLRRVRYFRRRSLNVSVACFFLILSVGARRQEEKGGESRKQAASRGAVLHTFRSRGTPAEKKFDIDS